MTKTSDPFSFCRWDRLHSGNLVNDFESGLPVGSRHEPAARSVLLPRTSCQLSEESSGDHGQRRVAGKLSGLDGQLRAAGERAGSEKVTATTARGFLARKPLPCSRHCGKRGGYRSHASPGASPSFLSVSGNTGISVASTTR